jgi:hypothetical protein
MVPLSAQSQQTSAFNTVELTKKAKPAVVLIKGLTADNQEISGSGFIVDGSGTIITNLHVVQELKTGGVRLTNGDIYDKITVRAFDERKDLAVIQIAGFDLPILPLGNSNNVQAGEQILLVGNPLGLEASVTTGIVSAIRQLNGGFQVIQTDAAANPGNSGGPMLNAKGEVVGVVSYKLRGTENLNFAIAINYVRGLLSSKDAIPLDQIKNKLNQTPHVFQEESSTYPKLWKSLSTGTTKIIRKDGDRLYVETVLPEELLKQGDFILSELKKVGDKYVGTDKHRLSCQYDVSYVWSIERRSKTCTIEAPIEITLLTPTRIEGWTMVPAESSRLNCRKCTLELIRQSFVWIPE